jgi:hypothetical protein
MAAPTLELEGPWEEILSHSKELEGRRVRVTVLQTEEEAEQEFHRQLIASGLVKQIRTPPIRPESERPLVTIQGEPLSETIIRDRR